LPRDRLVVSIKHKCRIGAVLLVKATKDQNGRRVDLVGHGQVAGHPSLLVLHIDDVPHVPLDVVALAHVSDLLRTELYAPGEHVDELGVEDAARSRVSRHVEVGHANPLICADIVVLARLVEVLRIVAPDDVNAVLLALVDGCEVAARVVEVGPVLEHAVLLDVLEHPVAADVLLLAARNAV